MNNQDFLRAFDVCDETTDNGVPRLCQTCLRARCICYSLPNPRPIALHRAKEMQIVVLQHPSEAKEYKNTVNLLKVCVENVSVLNGQKFKSDNGGVWDKACADLEHSYLLFPDKNATDAKDLFNSETETLSCKYLIVLDGTWTSCKRIYKKNEEILSKMKRVAIHPEIPSNYRIRKQPSPDCLSSIEAVAYCLMVIEQDPVIYEKLTKPLDGLVESYHE
jgi:DTW domain-containing protein YfiP